MVLPSAFISRTKMLLGNEWDAFMQALQEESPVSIRINPVKKASLSFESSEKVYWASNAFYLNGRPSFTLDPLFHAGCYYVQEASSMFLEQIVAKQISQPVKVLDLCAAPGGKSTHLVSILPEGSLLVSNEAIRSRAFVLAENLVKWGNPHAIVTNNDPSVFGQLEHFFDLIVADVPCSGEGLFRKNPESIREWSVEQVRFCAERQKRILANSWKALKPGGLLIYSTCTYNREENEDNIVWICQNLGAEPTEAVHRFFPHQTKGEGFFITAVRKKEDSEKNKESRRNGKKRDHHLHRIPQELKMGLTDPNSFVIFPESNAFIAIPSTHEEDYLFLKNRLKIVSAGIPLGETKGKDMIPAHALAMSNFLSKPSFPILELSKEASLKYLRKEALSDIPVHFPKGYALVSYLQQPLGFIKNINHRANNLYPQEWRIRMNIQTTE
ncbi:MAG: RsmB/NOP family class I SAM-dependent RNA methyltransferase [Candidatus Azobacteroides sp.]|nr:RsmB/NOP family class I SAM-dependent RNA methyltransferase [Candidatus Azobacteroides sp.]